MLQVPGGPGMELSDNKALVNPIRVSDQSPHKQERRLHRLPEVDVRQQQEHALQRGVDNQVD